MNARFPNPPVGRFIDDGRVVEVTKREFYETLFGPPLTDLQKQERHDRAVLEIERRDMMTRGYPAMTRPERDAHYAALRAEYRRRKAEIDEKYALTDALKAHGADQ